MDVNDLYERGFAGGTSRQFSPPKTGGPSVSRLHWLKCPAINSSITRIPFHLSG
ncbi:hypothetical protein PO124_17030 [Bacillus licheniformis]|nr:hypothetical protein [Bacillus licheniformis]